MNKNNRVLIFDCFGVIFNEVSINWFKQYLSIEQISQIDNTVLQNADLGTVSSEEFYAKLSNLTGVSPRQIEQDWLNIAAVDPEIIKLFNKYSNTYRFSLLSNAINPFIRDILRINDLEKYFEDIVISCEVGLAKPDPKIYELALSRLKITPDQATMIDDRIKNIEAAKSVGMNAILFHSAKELDEYLSKFKN